MSSRALSGGPVWTQGLNFSSQKTLDDSWAHSGGPYGLKGIQIKTVDHTSIHLCVVSQFQQQDVCFSHFYSRPKQRKKVLTPLLSPISKDTTRTPTLAFTGSSGGAVNVAEFTHNSAGHHE